MIRPAFPQNRYRYTATASIAVALAMPFCAVAKTETGANLSLSAATSSNPFQSAVANTGSASASLAVAPWLTFTNAENKLRLAGDVRITEYAETFPRTETFSLSANGTWQLDPRLSLVSNVSYSEATVGETNLFANQTTGVVVIEDPTLIGLRSRRRAFNTSLTANYRPDARQAWTFLFYASESRFSNAAAGNNFAVYGETIRYDRVLRRGTFGASLNLQRYECRSLQACSQVVTSPQLTASIRLDPLWTLSGSAGISYLQLRQPTFSSNTVTPAVSANLCRTQAKSSVCLSVGHTVEATALQGARPIVSASLSANYRVTERNTVILSGNYAGSTRAGLRGDTFRFFGARLTDEHRVNRRLNLFVVGSHTINDSSFVGRQTNTEASVGVRVSIGRGA